MTVDEALKMAREAAAEERQAGDDSDAIVFTERELRQFLAALLDKLAKRTNPSFDEALNSGDGSYRP